MKSALAIFAVLIVVSSAFTIIFPSNILSFAAEFLTDPGGIWWAAAMRLVLAALLWFSAPVSRTPTAFRVLAGVLLFVAVAIPIVGSEQLISLINWFASQSLWFVRALSGLGVGFGAFILWSVSRKRAAA